MPEGKRQRKRQDQPGAQQGQAKARKSRSGRSSLVNRMLSALKGLFGRGRKPRKRKASAKPLLLPGGGQKRTLAQWKELRRRTTAEVKVHLAEQQPLQAIKKLTRALLEDPQHPAYHELLRKAVEQRRQRRSKLGRKDPWAELPKELKQEALQLEAFSAYVDELEQLLDKAGIPPLSAPPPPDPGQGRRRQNKGSAEAHPAKLKT